MPKIRVNKKLRTNCDKYNWRAIRLQFETTDGGTCSLEGAVLPSRVGKINKMFEEICKLMDECELTAKDGDACG